MLERGLQQTQGSDQGKQAESPDSLEMLYLKRRDAAAELGIRLYAQTRSMPAMRTGHEALYRELDALEARIGAALAAMTGVPIDAREGQEVSAANVLGGGVEEKPLDSESKTASQSESAQEWNREGPVPIPADEEFDYCPKCKIQPVPKGDQYCMNCSADVSLLIKSVPDPKPEPASEPSTPIAYCGNCGLVAGPSDKWCTKCSEPIVRDEVAGGFTAEDGAQ